MRTLFLDCFAGISGDMLVGALLECGVELETLRGALAKLDLRGYEIGRERVDRCGISATKFNVRIAAKAGHDHRHGETEASQTPGEHPHRPLAEIRQMIEASSLSLTVKETATKIFQRLGEAESKIHHVAIEKVQFHEVGAVDSIVDIVGAAICLEKLEVKRVLSSALHVGSGTFTCAHGVYPVPGPATAELLRDIPIYASEVDGELVTPTGAAIVTTIADEFGRLPQMKVEVTGYGAGTREYPKFPNVLRVFLGASGVEETPTTVAVLETNIDDLNPQVFGYLMELLFDEGALDVFYTPVQMKKNRPGLLVTVLCEPAARGRMEALLFRETTTLGVRHRFEQRVVLKRKRMRIKTQFGEITIKVAIDDLGRRINYAPEYDDCVIAARENGVAVREVQTAAIAAYLASV